MTQFLGWLKNIFVPAIFAAESYDDQDEKTTKYIGNKRSVLIGMPRLRQLRVKKGMLSLKFPFQDLQSRLERHC